MVKTPHWPIPLGSKPIDLGLSRIKQLLKNLGIDETKLPPALHVAGTNGKGSTIAFLRSFLEAAGYKVHVYTSPHLVNFNERIVLAGKEISDELLFEILEECRLASKGSQITFFEGTTAAAFLAFSKVPADIILLETGLGGRLDATNIIEKPLLTIITPVSFDHMEFLGNSLKEIAGEKAAIIKDRVPCVLASQQPEALNIIVNEASKKNAPLIAEGKQWRIEINKNGFSYISDKNKLDFPLPALPGSHQVHNAGTAIAAAHNLKGFDISKDAIVRGLQSVKWPARLQEIKSGNLKNILPGNFSLWVDGGHNEAGGKIIGDWLKTREEKIYIICGMLEDKDSEAFLKNLQGRAEYFFSIPIPNEEKSKNAYGLAAIGEKIGITIEPCDNIREVLEKISGLTSEPALILICGSLYLAGYILDINNSYDY